MNPTQLLAKIEHLIVLSPLGSEREKALKECAEMVQEIIDLIEEKTNDPTIPRSR